MANLINNLFGIDRALIGMIHIGALPGTPRASLSIDRLIEIALAEARIYQEAGFHGLLLENMHDRPYLKGRVGPEIVAALAVAARAIHRAVDLPLGIQVLAGANREALAIAQCSGACFVRVEGFVFAHVADEGIIDAGNVGAGELLRYRRHIGAEHIRIFADIKKKHAAHAITGDVSPADTARAAAFFLADGVIVTGSATGEAANPQDVEDVVQAVRLPVLVGSGVTPANLADYAGADALIVGSWVKQDGRWDNPVEEARVQALSAAFRKS